MAYISIRLHSGVTLSGGAAKTLIGYALRRRGRSCWEEIAVDVFSGAGETLLLARPGCTLEVRVADYALPVLLKYLSA